MERYNTFWRRFGAGLIDGLVLLPVTVALAVVIAHKPGPLTLLLWAVFSGSLGWTYSIALHAKYGQTFGKMITGVKVLDITEHRLPTVAQAIWRDSGAIALDVFRITSAFVSGSLGAGSASSLPGRLALYTSNLWFLLEVVTMLANPRRRALHDLIAGTVVVRTRLEPAGVLPFDGGWRDRATLEQR
jgi:uncharacterized RDD family membrane protein YckC